jgi:hypothetical protein
MTINRRVQAATLSEHGAEKAYGCSPAALVSVQPKLELHLLMANVIIPFSDLPKQAET